MISCRLESPIVKDLLIIICFISISPDQWIRSASSIAAHRNGYKKKTRYLKLTEYYEGFPRLLQMGLRTQGRKQDGVQGAGRLPGSEAVPPAPSLKGEPVNGLGD